MLSNAWAYLLLVCLIPRLGLLILADEEEGGGVLDRRRRRRPISIPPYEPPGDYAHSIQDTPRTYEQLALELRNRLDALGGWTGELLVGRKSWWRSAISGRKAITVAAFVLPAPCGDAKQSHLYLPDQRHADDWHPPQRWLFGSDGAVYDLTPDLSPKPRYPKRLTDVPYGIDLDKVMVEAIKNLV